MAAALASSGLMTASQVARPTQVFLFTGTCRVYSITHRTANIAWGTWMLLLAEALSPATVLARPLSALAEDQPCNSASSATAAAVETGDSEGSRGRGSQGARPARDVS